MVVRSSVPNQYQAEPDNRGPRVLLRAGVTFVRASSLILTDDPEAVDPRLLDRGVGLPTWAAGPFCRVRVAEPFWPEPGLYLLVADGAAAYLGAADDLAAAFDAETGVAAVRPGDLTDPARLPAAWVNHLLAVARDHRQRVEVYVHLTDRPHAMITPEMRAQSNWAWDAMP